MQLVTHEEPTFLSRVTKNNGAVTYSSDIVRYQADRLRDNLPGNIVVSTAPRLSSLDVSGDIAVQYLHSYTYSNPLSIVNEIVQSGKFKKYIFVTAYKQMKNIIEAKHPKHRCVWIPMTIDTDAVQQYRRETTTIPYLWFGNVYSQRRSTMQLIRQHTRCQILSESKWNGRTLNQQQCWEIVSQAGTVFAVGRAALEAYSLGCRVIIAGENFGGVVTNKHEAEMQQATNYNGRIVTYDRDIYACLNAPRYRPIARNMDIKQLNHGQIILGAL